MILETFHERLLWARRHKSLTQRKLAERMEKEYEVLIGANYLSELELGKDKKPSFEVVRAIAGVTEVSLDWLARFTSDPARKSSDTDDSYWHPETDEVAQLVDRMPAEQRAMILSLAKSLAPNHVTERKRLSEAREILNSIERKWGRDTRLDVERLMRSRNIPIDDTP